MLSWVRVTCLLIAGLLAPSALHAQVVVHVEGQGAKKIRNQLSKALPEGINAVDPAAFTSALGREALGNEAVAPGNQEALVAELSDAAKKAGAQLVIVALVKAGGKSMWLLAVQTADNKIVHDATYTVRKMVTKGKKRRRKKVPGPLNLRAAKTALAPILATVTPPPPVETETLAAAPAESNEVVEPEESSRRSRRRRYGPVDPELRRSGLYGEPRFFIAGRKLSFLRRGDYLRGVRAHAIPMLGVNSEFYPGVLFDIDAIDWLGVGFRFATALSLAAHDPDNDADTFDTTYWTVEGDIRPRFSFGPVTLAPAVGVGGTTFDFTVPTGSLLTGQTPGVSYVYLRAGADVLLYFEPVSIFGGISYLYNFSIGTLGEYFPSHVSMGFSAKLGAAFQILDWLEVRAGGDYTQISLKFEPEAGSVYQAVSGTDHLYGGFVGVAVFYPP